MMIDEEHVKHLSQEVYDLHQTVESLHEKVNFMMKSIAGKTSEKAGDGIGRGGRAISYYFSCEECVCEECVCEECVCEECVAERDYEYPVTCTFFVEEIDKIKKNRMDVEILQGQVNFLMDHMSEDMRKEWSREGCKRPLGALIDKNICSCKCCLNEIKSDE